MDLYDYVHPRATLSNFHYTVNEVDRVMCYTYYCTNHRSFPYRYRQNNSQQSVRHQRLYSRCNSLISQIFMNITYFFASARVYFWQPKDFEQTAKHLQAAFLTICVLINVYVGVKQGFREAFSFTGVFYFFIALAIFVGSYLKMLYVITISFSLIYMGIIIDDWPKPMTIFFVFMFYFWFGIMC